MQAIDNLTSFSKIARRKLDLKNMIIAIKKICVLCFALLIGASCHEQNKNKITPAELMKSREIRKVSEAEILQKAGELGVLMLDSIRDVVKSKSYSNTMSCEVSQWKELDAIEVDMKAEIKKVNQGSVGISELELQLLSAYQYNLENKLNPTASVQKLDSRTVLFAFPIDSTSNIYKYCLDSIERKNAEMWSIKFPVKEIVKRL